MRPGTAASWPRSGWVSPRQRAGQAQVLAWAEQGRARHLLSRPAHQPDDRELAEVLARLRGTVGEIEDLRRAGGRSPALDRQQAALERQIRDHCRRQPRTTASNPAPAVSVKELADALGEAALVEYFQLNSELHAVTVVNGRARLLSIGPLEPARDAVEHAAFAVRRMARHKISDSSRSAAVVMLRHAAARLDAMLLKPLTGLIGNRPLVVVPTGPLQSLPWSILPSCADRPVMVAPSAALWYAAERREERWQGRISIVAGPGLPGARAEAEAVAAIYGTKALTDSAATVATVSAALNRADLVHLAAHGRVRADNPLFSSLRLADGPLTVFDLERLDRVAPVVIAAACDSGRSVVCAGDEILGFSATLLSLGTEQLIASVVPVPDAETAPLMVAFHRQLAAGYRIAEALSQAQQQVRSRPKRRYDRSSRRLHLHRRRPESSRVPACIMAAERTRAPPVRGKHRVHLDPKWPLVTCRLVTCRVLSRPGLQRTRPAMENGVDDKSLPGSALPGSALPNNADLSPAAGTGEGTPARLCRGQPGRGDAGAGDPA